MSEIERELANAKARIVELEGTCESVLDCIVTLHAHNLGAVTRRELSASLQETMRKLNDYCATAGSSRFASRLGQIPGRS